MSYLPPLTLEQVIWLKPGYAAMEYTLKEEEGVSWLDVQLDILAISYEAWTITDVRVELALMDNGKRKHVTLVGSPFKATLIGWITENCNAHLQRHVDENFVASDVVTDARLDEAKHAD